MLPPQEDLQSLRRKYERMLALRNAHARAQADASFVEPDPRPEMAQLAAEYPGSLRELDMLALDVIVARIEALSLAERDAVHAEPWMGAQTIFHRLARGALVTKRWLAGRKTITAATREAFLEALPALPWSADAGLFADDLGAVAQPPRGRVMDLVHTRVAERLDLTEAEARALVLTARPRC